MKKIREYIKEVIRSFEAKKLRPIPVPVKTQKPQSRTNY